MRSNAQWWIMIVVCIIATQLSRFAPFLFMRFFEDNKPLEQITKRLAPSILALLILYCFKDNLIGGVHFTYDLVLPLIIVVYLQIKSKNALLSIGVATFAHAFLLKLGNS
jgi:branched-subunit amino acid transport protein AzlD